MRIDVRCFAMRGLAAALLFAFVVILAMPSALAQLPMPGAGSEDPAAAPTLQQMLDQMPKPLSTDQVDAILAVLDIECGACRNTPPIR